ncbi:MAG: signal peptidase II [Planctomycetota bacterium]
MKIQASGADRGKGRAWRSPLAWIVLLTVVAGGVSLDLWLKHWSFENVAPHPVVLDRDVIRANPNWHIPPHDPVPVVPRVLNLHLVMNDGAVFGIGANQRMFFVVFTVVALAAAVLVFGRWTTRRATMAHIALALILAGGLGNLYDRITLGFVRDFLHMLPGWRLPFGWNWPGGSTEVFPWVFNAADVMLLLGMGTLMVYMNGLEKRRKQVRAARDQAPDSPQPESA